MSKHKSPEWLLSEEWGIGRDPYNWILYTRKRGKKLWRAEGYFNSISNLVEFYYEKRCLVDKPADTLAKHLLGVAASCGCEINAIASRVGALDCFNDLPQEQAA